MDLQIANSQITNPPITKKRLDPQIANLQSGTFPEGLQIEQII
jgi:hypothetical protein